MPLHKVTCVPRGHALGVVRMIFPFSCRAWVYDVPHQTSQLPENDRLSVSLKEYLAEIDVCMGGRVAEELSKSTSSRTAQRTN
jgi:ATP-dependent metalloprotease